MPNKTCPKCSVSLHVRKSQCTCGHIFYATAANPNIPEQSNTTKSAEVIPVFKVRKTALALRPPWRQLREGDLIKVDGGGPFWVNKDGQNIAVGEHGEFVVTRLAEDGVYAREYTHDIGYMVFLPMKTCSHYGLTYEPYTFKMIDNIYDRVNAG